MPLLLQIEHCDALQTLSYRVIEDQGQLLGWVKKNLSIKKNNTSLAIEKESK